MNAITTEADFTFDHAAFHELEPGVPDHIRYDGWTADKQKRFLVALSRGHNVGQACAIVGMSRQSAYALRTATRGAAFRLGWDAALLHARDVLADELMDRAFNGVKEHVTADNGAITTRLRHDNILAFKMLNRLDRRADAACTDANAAAVRLAAADFEQLLELIAQEAAPARAGLFLAARLGALAAEATEDDLAPIRTLARADRWLRTHTDLGQGIDTADLDPADRARWTAEQWARAEAAGLVQLAPAPEPEPDTPDSSQVCQPHEDAGPSAVWWCYETDGWRTSFPPPEGFDGLEDGEPGDADYERELTLEEEEAMELQRSRELAPFVAAGHAEREAWLAACRGEADAGSACQAPRFAAASLDHRAAGEAAGQGSERDAACNGDDRGVGAAGGGAGDRADGGAKGRRSGRQGQEDLPVRGVDGLARRAQEGVQDPRAMGCRTA